MLSVQLRPTHNFFIVAQVDGTINFRSMKDGSHLCNLNSTNWNASFFRTAAQIEQLEGSLFNLAGSKGPMLLRDRKSKLNQELLELNTIDSAKEQILSTKAATNVSGILSPMFSP